MYRICSQSNAHTLYIIHTHTKLPHSTSVFEGISYNFFVFTPQKQWVKHLRSVEKDNFFCRTERFWIYFHTFAKKKTNYCYVWLLCCSFHNLCKSKTEPYGVCVCARKFMPISCKFVVAVAPYRGKNAQIYKIHLDGETKMCMKCKLSCVCECSRCYWSIPIIS